MRQSFDMPTIYSRSVTLDEDAVHILDRRIFPFKTEFVTCRTVMEVADAIEGMVTQSNGPFYASGAGMVLAARVAAAQSANARLDHMEAAATQLIATRPTNNNVASAVKDALAAARSGKEDAPASFASRIEKRVRTGWDNRRNDLKTVGKHAASLVRDGEGLMTYCWSEGAIMETLAEVRRSGRSITFYCPETRPYLQGARLTSHSAAEMGIDAVVMTDGMGAHAMAEGKVTMLMTAADRVTMSGHVINKVGTLQMAIAARHFSIPYFATVLEPDINAAVPGDVEMEERDGEESLHCLGQRTASPLVRGWYPAFDVTPPTLISGIVTRHGIQPAAALRQALPDVFFSGADVSPDSDVGAGQ